MSRIPPRANGLDAFFKSKNTFLIIPSFFSSNVLQTVCTRKYHVTKWYGKSYNKECVDSAFLEMAVLRNHYSLRWPPRFFETEIIRAANFDAILASTVDREATHSTAERRSPLPPRARHFPVAWEDPSKERILHLKQHLETWRKTSSAQALKNVPLRCAYLNAINTIRWLSLHLT